MDGQGIDTDIAPTTTLGGVNIQLRLNSLENSRKSFARLIRMYLSDEMDRVMFRDLVFAMSGYLGYWKTELETDIEERLTALEERGA